MFLFSTNVSMKATITSNPTTTAVMVNILEMLITVVSALAFTVSKESVMEALISIIFWCNNPDISSTRGVNSSLKNSLTLSFKAFSSSLVAVYFSTISEYRLDASSCLTLIFTYFLSFIAYSRTLSMMTAVSTGLRVMNPISAKFSTFWITEDAIFSNVESFSSLSGWATISLARILSCARSLSTLVMLGRMDVLHSFSICHIPNGCNFTASSVFFLSSSAACGLKPTLLAFFSSSNIFANNSLHPGASFTSGDFSSSKVFTSFWFFTISLLKSFSNCLFSIMDINIVEMT